MQTVLTVDVGQIVQGDLDRDLQWGNKNASGSG